MSGITTRSIDRSHSYGEKRLTMVDRFGIYLSRRAIERAVGCRRGLEILDIGCGYHATMLKELTPRLKRGVGVDLRISDTAKGRERLEFIESTVEEALISISAQSFDLVLLISVLEHLRNPLEIMEQIRRVLKPGGVALVNVPTWRGKTFLEFSAFRLGTSPACEMDDHKMYFDKRDLWPMLVRAGFKPSLITLRYHKCGLNLFAIARAGIGESNRGRT